MTGVSGNMFLAGVGTLLMANTIPNPGPLQYTVQYSALGMLGWAVWYMLAKAFPRHLKAQQQEREALLRAHQEALDAILEIVRANKGQDWNDA